MKRTELYDKTAFQLSASIVISRICFIRENASSFGNKYIDLSIFTVVHLEQDDGD